MHLKVKKMFKKVNAFRNNGCFNDTRIPKNHPICLILVTSLGGVDIGDISPPRPKTFFLRIFINLFLFL